jgi:hypothetical protein
MYRAIQKNLEHCLNQMTPSPADIPSVRSSQPVNDIGFLAQLMPSQGRARFLRGVARVFLAIGILGSISVGASVFSELHARHSWPVAQGVIVAKDLKDNKDIPGNLNRRTNYWIEYEVRFAVPAEQCRTGTIYGDEREPLPCWGIARTRTTESPATAYQWLMRHPLNSAVGILHDPNGPNIKIADEPFWLVYPVKGILVMSGWMAFFLTFLNITQRRLQFLETLPDDYDASRPPASKPPGPNDSIELKLS